MHTVLEAGSEKGCYAGLRLDAEQYDALPPDGNRYELVDGVVIMSPSSLPMHQQVALELAYQIKAHLRDREQGVVFVEVDLFLPLLT